MNKNQKIILNLTFPPSTNTYWRHVGNKILLSKKGREYKSAVYAAVKLSGVKKLPDVDLQIKILAYPPNKRKRDLDNIFKSLFDALGYAGVYSDDSQIKKIDAEMCGVKKGGFVEVEIMEL